jgi:hypothetical protein
MKQERKTELLSRLPMYDDQGREVVVPVTGQYMRQQFQDGTWTDWLLEHMTFSCPQGPVNKLDGLEGEWFEIVSTGTRIRLRPAAQA